MTTYVVEDSFGLEGIGFPKDFLEGSLEGIRDIEMRILPEFWGSELKKRPEIKFGKYCEEDHINYTILISNQKLNIYGQKPAELTSQPPIVGFSHYIGHSLNHFFMGELNKDTIIYGSKIPIDESSNRGIIEAMVNTVTTWLLDKLKYDGVGVSEAWYESEQRLPDCNLSGSKRSKEHFKTFMSWVKPGGKEYSEKGIEKFKDFVKNYSCEKVYEF